MEEFNNKFEDFILVRYSTIYTKIEEKEEYKKVANDVMKKYVGILQKLKAIGREDIMDEVTSLLDLTDERNDVYIKELYKYAFADGLYFKDNYKIND